MSQRRTCIPLLALALLVRVLSAEPCVVISEIMYHPADEGEILEYVELHNPEAPRADLTDWRLEGEIACTFPRGSVLLPGEYLVVARAPSVLQKAYFLPRCPLAFTGRLNNKGGKVRLVNAAGTTACEVDYNDRDPWPLSADGTGHSLSLCDPLLDVVDPASWAQSPTVGGTPGASNGFGPGPGRVTLAPLPRIRINEIAGGAKGFVELFNASGNACDLGGFFFTNDLAFLAKYRFPPGSVLAPYGYLALTPGMFDPGFTSAEPNVEFALATPDGKRVVDAARARNLTDGASRGRVPDATGSFEPCAMPTPGAPNKPAPAPDLVISEIMYHPITEDDRDEYLEIYNRGAQSVDLTDFTVKGIGFKFPAKARIGPKAYAVVAKDPARIASRYSVKNVALFGPYEGTLADGGETIRIEDPAGVLVDAVTYGDRTPWPKWADGLGSSLELIDVEGPNDLPGAWGASDDSAAAQWQTFEYAGTHHAFLGTNLSEFQFLLLDVGECLIDNVVVASQDEALVKEGFERGSLGWNALGTHDRSGVTGDKAASDKGAYRIVAEGRGDPRHNYISVSVRKNLVPEKRYFLRFRAKWQRGAVQILTRTIGQGVAKTHTLMPPKKLGTPGAPNGIARATAGVFVETPLQMPIAPDAQTPVAFEVRVESRAIPAGTDLCYRRDGESDWKKIALAKSGLPARGDTSRWSGAIPAQPAGLVEFYVEARDSAGTVGRFPADAPARTASYLVGLACHASLPTYHLLVPKLQWDALQARPRLSNRLGDATFVYGNAAIFYNVGFRPRGSPYTRDLNSNWRIRFGEKRLGNHRAYTLDGQKQDGTRQRERVVHWLLTCVRAPSLRQRYVSLNIAGRAQDVFEDVERIDGDFLTRWFPGGEHGNLHKIDDYFELLPGRGAEQQRVEADFKWKGPDPELYRWNFAPRALGSVEDFEPLMRFIALMDPDVTKTNFAPQFEKAVDVDEWLRAFAVRTICDDWDTMGRGRGKNAYVYRTPGKDGAWHLLVWDSDLTFRNAQSTLFPDKFASFKRILAEAPYRRHFLSYLGYLARGPLTGDLPAVLQDTSKACGANPAELIAFAAARCTFVLSQIPEGPRFTVEQVQRVSPQGKPDIVRATGKAPTLASRFSLDGRTGSHRFVDAERWVAEFPVGPAGGAMTLAAEDVGGARVAAQTVKISSRAGAVALAPLEPLVVEPPYAPPPVRPPPCIITLGGAKKSSADVAVKPPAAKTQATVKPAETAPLPDGESLLSVDAESSKEAPEEEPAERPSPPPTAANEGPAAITTAPPASAATDDVATIARVETPNPRAKAAPARPAPRPPAAESTGSGKDFFYLVAGALLCLGLLGALIVGVVRQLRSFGVAAGEKEPMRGAAGDEKPTPRRDSHVVLDAPAARKAPPPRPVPAPAPTPSTGTLDAAQLLTQLANSEYQTAARAFSKLARLDAATLNALPKDPRRDGATPFGKIRRGPAGLTPVPAGELPPLTVGAVIDLLIAALRTPR